MVTVSGYMKRLQAELCS